jgi:hypothetical protein
VEKIKIPGYEVQKGMLGNDIFYQDAAASADTAPEKKVVTIRHRPTEQAKST